MSIYQKICPSCGIVKLFEEFYKHKRKKDGLSYSCKVCCKLNSTRYNNSNKEKKSEYQKKYYSKNKNKLKEYNDQYHKNNKQKRNQRESKRRDQDHLYKLGNNISTLIRVSLKRGGYKKNSKSTNILGCSIIDFHSHLEKLFIDGMSWENRDLWQIDHIIPISWAKTEEELIALNHYTNLQPLWKEDNIIKGNKYSGDNKSILEHHAKLKVGYRNNF